MAETYSRDLGRKISASKQSKIMNGEFVRKDPFYGYKIDVNRKYIIDEAVADNVRLIFSMASQGFSCREIRQELYDLKIEPPSKYKNTLNANYHKRAIHDGVWSTQTLLKILRDKRYIGTYDGGFHKTTIIPNKTCIAIQEADRVNIPDHHPAMITVDVFEKVQELFPRNKSCATKKSHLSSEKQGFLWCLSL